MARWIVTYTLVDDNSPTPAYRTKRFKGDFADYAAASAAETALRTDLATASSAAIARVQLTEDTVIASPTPASGSDLYAVASVTVPITATKNANFRLPAADPLMVVTGNNIDTANALWTDLMDNFTAAGWEISDGEHIDPTLPLAYGRGRLIKVRSGQDFNF